MTYDEEMGKLVSKLSRTVDGIKGRARSPYTPDVTAVGGIMAIAEARTDLTAERWRQINDLTRRIEALERKRKTDEKRK